jgi:hypothetical protein
LVGCLFSVYPTYREIFTINAICQWCVASAVLMTLPKLVTAIRVLRLQLEPATPTPLRRTGVHLESTSGPPGARRPERTRQLR